MKKNFKLILALIMAAMMVVSMASVAAFAADEGSGTTTSGTAPAATGYTITVPTSDTHEYKVYQILTGKLNDAKDVLSNAAWGSSVKTITEGKVEGKTVVEFMKLMETKSGNDAVTEALKYVDTAKQLTGTIKAGTPMSGLAEGYYILVDVTTPLTYTTGEGDDAVTHIDTKALSLLQLVDNVTVEKKWGSTEDKKTIDTDTLGKTGTETNNINDDDDNVSIGDTVNYKIEAKVPENTDKFAPGTFFFVITDKLSAGLTFNDDIKVYLKGAGEEGADLELAATDYTIKKGDATVYGEDDTKNTFEVALKDAADAKYRGQTIIVKYSATVNENAVIGDAGNPNTSTVQFSNNPDQDYDGKPDEDEDGFPDTITDVPTGTTPDSTTYTYVTGIEILKVDENGEPLQNAKFTISGDSVKKVVTKTEEFVAYTAADEANAADYKYYKLKDGTYTMTAPKEENEMVAAQAGATKGYVVDADATGDGVIEIDGIKYRPVKTDETPTHVLKVGSAAAYDSTTTKYKKTVTQKTVDGNVEDKKMEEQVDSKGLVRFDGLGAGTYHIVESQTPDGYNTIDPFDVTVTYSDPDAQGATTAKFTVSGGEARYEDGIIKITIVNKKGQKLPETGGIGTTIFYVAGSILVLAAAILLVTKRRMGAND